ncbi:MAG: sel1 repeat family protein [Desulfovibrionaceae bacterium]|nr:sel1 repeat family protein [Desulfovibrionaceae bacterium]
MKKTNRNIKKKNKKKRDKYSLTNRQNFTTYVSEQDVDIEDLIVIDDIDIHLKRAHQGFAKEQYDIGALYIQGSLPGGSFREGLDLVTRSAAQGYSKAEALLGRIYTGQFGATLNLSGMLDIDKGLWYLSRAFEQNNKDAALYLGLFYLRGENIDIDKAIHYLTRAKELGHKDAPMALAYAYKQTSHIIPGNSRLAFENMKIAAESGNVEAMVSLGAFYAIGKLVPQDFDKANEWYEKAAALGNPRAKANLGAVYLAGRNVPKDMAKALKLFEEAAEAGEGLALVNLGTMYHQGLYVDKDLHTARKYYERAAEVGEVQAQLALAMMYINQEVPVNPNRSVPWIKKAAESGFGPCQMLLAYMYENGIGVPKDELQAFNLYKTITTQKDVFDEQSLGVLYMLNDTSPNDAVYLHDKQFTNTQARAWNALSRYYAEGIAVEKDPDQASYCLYMAKKLGYEEK